MKLKKIFPVILFIISFNVFSQELDDEELLLFEDDGITVLETKKTTQQMDTITKEDIEKSGAFDIADLLQETVGLGITRYGAYGNQTEINLRGFDSERVAFLIDGVPVNSPASGEFDVSMLDINAIERIEVIYGGSDSKYNVTGAFGGVINIITVKKQPPGLHITTSMSNTSSLPGVYYDRDGNKYDGKFSDLFDTQNLALGLTYGLNSNSFSANIFFNRAGNHYLYNDRIFEITRRKEYNEVWDSGANFSFVHTLSDEITKVIAGADIYYGDKNIPSSGYADFGGKQIDFSTRENIAFDAPRAFTDTVSSEASITHKRHTFDFTSYTGAPTHHNVNYVTLINRWAWYPAGFFTLRAGGDFRYVILDSSDFQKHDRGDGGVYLSAEYKPRGRIVLVPSIKVVSDGSSIVPIPKFGILWNVADTIAIKNNYFRNFKFPDFEDLYWPSTGVESGNPDLKPEDGWGTDIGIAYNALNEEYFLHNINASFFYQWTSDSIHWASGSDNIWRPSNVGEAVIFGAEAGVDTVFMLKKNGNSFPELIKFSVTYQYMLSYMLSYGFDYASDKRIPYMPAHTISAAVELPWKTGTAREGSLRINAHFESSRYADTNNIKELDPYTLITVNVNQKINDTLKVYGIIRNAANISYESFDNYPMPGLTLTLGMRYNIL